MFVPLDPREELVNSIGGMVQRCKAQNNKGCRCEKTALRGTERCFIHVGRPEYVIREWE